MARTIYRAGSVSFAPAALRRLQKAEAEGMGRFPVCIAKTQFSFSADAKRYGAVSGFDLPVRDVVLNAGELAYFTLNDNAVSVGIVNNLLCKGDILIIREV